MQTCYVCSTNVDTEIDKYCFRDEEDGSKGYRHFWHGVPGIRHTAPSAGIQGYAMSLADAKKRAEYYINENPWAAPEVKESEQLILEEVNRLEGLNN